jgi:recombination protein RecR
LNFSSKLIEKGVEAFASLPGIGRKTALRLVLHLIQQDKTVAGQFTDAIAAMREGIRICRNCHNLSDNELCGVCSDNRRDGGVICVVEGIRDLMAIEETQQYKGVYHVLGGIISPIEGITPAELNVDSLLERVQKGTVKEIIMAISPTIEGETTMYYLAQRLKPFGVSVSVIARGVAFGGELEYADEITLGRSIAARMPYVRQ